MNVENEIQTPSYMELAPIKFLLRFPEHKENVKLKNQLMAGIIEGNMAPYYSEICKDFDWTIQQDLLEKMSAANQTQLSIYDKDEICGHTSDDDEPKAWYDKLLYLCAIGDKDASVRLATTKSEDKTLTLNRRLDVTFAMFRIAYFHGCDVRGMRDAVDRAAQMIDSSSSGGDWSARNKLKAYQALCSLAVRDYAAAAPLFLDAIPTYESTELTSFDQFLRYALFSAMVALPRSELHESLSKPGIIPQALKAKTPDLREFYMSLHECRYADFFISLARIEEGMKVDPILHPHYRHYVREMRVRAYAQQLHAYRSLSLHSMAESFGVSEELMETEVARFSAARRLQCKIDKVARKVITGNYVGEENPDDASVRFAPCLAHDRALMYKTIIKRGDNLLNRLKNLARVLDF